ncbi:MAG: cache domain-containing protein, partial [SAR324 cluster bacterium]|nr:cache domain-containing protein [SAR324 cluster bacterium]
MIRLKNIKMKPKLIGVLLLIGLLPLILVGWLSADLAHEALVKGSINQLESVRQIKKVQIENFLAERQGDMGVLVETVKTLRLDAMHKLEGIRDAKKQALQSYFDNRFKFMEDVQKNLRFTSAIEPFSSAFESGLESFQYKDLYEKRIAGFQSIVDTFGYYDVFLIDLRGNVVFTVTKESDLGENLETGVLKESGLAEAYRAGKKGIGFADFTWYGPSNEPAAFMSTPLYNEAGTIIGVAAFQVSLKEINEITQERSGLGKTGETYLVGPDFLMRSNSFLDPQNHSVEASFKNPEKGRAETEAVRSALSGKTLSDVIIDYNGNPVLSSWTTINIGNTKWALLAEEDVAEAFSPVDEQGIAFFAKYKEIYGYYDLFLINPDGYVFYTVTKEADFQSNMIDGKYADSNLGKLIRQVKSSRQFALADFAPYAPSQGEPASFIAQPVTHGEEVELIIALQLSLDAINNIMQQREGMGKSGETYLVG